MKQERENQSPESSPPETDSCLSAITPPTLAQRLKDYSLYCLREFRGVSLRLTTYSLSFATLATILQTHGVSEQDTFKIAVPTMIATMLAGELYFMDRLAQRFPWFRTHTLSGTKDLFNRH